MMKRAQLHLDTQSGPPCLKLGGGASGAAAGTGPISGYWTEGGM